MHFRRPFFFILGILLISVIIALGFYTKNNNGFAIWFGVITAFISPLAIELILYTFRSKEKVIIEKLSKVPEIDSLIKKAHDNEEKIALLLKQREELDLLIQYESKRRTLLAERDIFIAQGMKVIEELRSIDDRLTSLTKEKQRLPEYLKPLQEEIQKFNKNDVILQVKGKTYILNKDEFDLFPFYGELIFSLLKGFGALTKKERFTNK